MDHRTLAVQFATRWVKPRPSACRRGRPAVPVEIPYGSAAEPVDLVHDWYASRCIPYPILAPWQKPKQHSTPRYTPGTSLHKQIRLNGFLATLTSVRGSLEAFFFSHGSASPNSAISGTRFKTHEIPNCRGKIDPKHRLLLTDPVLCRCDVELFYRFVSALEEIHLGVFHRS